MRQCFRWFGPDDPVRLQDIRQTGATDIVSALHHIPYGVLWPENEIARRSRDISWDGDRNADSGLRWTIVESLPIHESIKLRSEGFLARIDSYKQSLVNLSRRGIKVVCFNFMPATDWTRTGLMVELADGSMVSSYDGVLVAAFDIFGLGRPEAKVDYPEATVAAATRAWSGMGKAERDKLAETILLGFPGRADGISLEALRERIAAYRGVTRARLRENLHSFLNAIVTVCEAHGLRLAIHPDDPPLSVFGLPRAMSTADDVAAMAEAVPSAAAGLALCTGSFGSRPDNDPAAIFERFADRVHFVHMRNVRFLDGRDDAFEESGSLRGAADLPKIMQALVREEERRKALGRADYRIPVRPDHGKLFARDKVTEFYPGYSFIGRAVNLAELRGMEAGIRQAQGLAETAEGDIP
jgi:mannonate dehydratase